MPAGHLQMVFFGDPNGYPPIINCARSLAEAGWSVDIFCRDERTHPEAAFPPRVRVERLRVAARGGWREYLGFVRALRRKLAPQASYVIGHDMHGLVGAALATRRRVPLIYHCHDFADRKRRLPPGSALVRRLERFFAPRAMLTVVPDADRGKVVHDELALPREVLVLPNAPRRAAIPTRGLLRETLGAQGRGYERVLLRQGRIGPNHGIEVTLRSMPRWDGSRWGFVLIGPAEPDFREKLHAMARDLGVAERLCILPVTSYDEIMRYTLEADLGHAVYEPANINHVEMGTASNKVLEYMAVGVPCLVSTSSSTARMVARVGCGVAADPADAVDVARAVNAVLGDPQAARRMGHAGRLAFERELCYEIGFQRLRAILDRPPESPWR